MAKQTATFKKFHQFETWANGRTAVLEGVLGHPRLGDNHMVYTSLVEEVEYEANSTEIIAIVTKNTIYTKET